MANLEERLAFLEGRVDEQSHMVNGIREALVNFEQRMDGRFEAIDRRFEAIDRRFEGLDLRLAGLDQKLDRSVAALDQKLSAFDQKLDQRFGWLIGIQVTTLLAMVTTLVAIILTLPGR